jgi:hypothetical protein
VIAYLEAWADDLEESLSGELEAVVARGIPRSERRIPSPA